MKYTILLRGGLAAVVASIGCGTSPPPPGGTTPTVSVQPAPETAPSTSASATADAAPVPEGKVRMYPVAQIYSLIDVTGTDGGIELRVGLDDGGGTRGTFRFVPFVNGAPDFAQETSEIFLAYTSGSGFIGLTGKRPGLLYHQSAGFRSSAVDSYSRLDEDNAWRHLATGVEDSRSNGIFPWAGDRLLEWRGSNPTAPATTEATAELPEWRVLQGTPKEAPSLGKAMSRKLTNEGFTVSTVTAFRTGEVIAVGRLTKAAGFGTLLWKDKLKEPAYWVTASEELTEESELKILGGDSLAKVRLQVGKRVLRTDGTTWTQESTVAEGARPEGSLPDVWFGSTQIVRNDTGNFARTSEKAAWLPIESHADPKARGRESFAVDPSGVIWKTEDELLLSSKDPGKPLLEITEEVIVAGRKASILRGGSDDVTGAAPSTFGTPTCSMYYVLLNEAKEAEADKADYPEIRKVLKGHSELAKAKLIVSREKGRQFFGALLANEGDAKALSTLVGKKVKGVRTLCASPAIVREIKIDFTSGDVVK